MRVLGSDSEQAEFARIQQSQFLSPVITDENGHLLHQLLSENILVDLQFLPEKIMTAAYAAKHWRRALTLADTAAALMIELELLLRPGDLTSLDLSEDGTLVSLARRHEQDRRPHLLPETQELLARRAELRRRRKLPLRPLFPAANGGSQLQRAVTARFSKFLRSSVIRRSPSRGCVISARSACSALIRMQSVISGLFSISRKCEP